MFAIMRFVLWGRRKLAQSKKRPPLVLLCNVEVRSPDSQRRPHMTHELISVPADSVERSILLIRRQKVILDRTLARLYRVSTKVLNQAVSRNLERFPPDFMFQLTMEEAKSLDLANSRSQIVTLKQPHGKHIKYRPYAFTEHGILMLSSVLRSERAVQVNIQIMRAFVRLREILASNAELNDRLDALEHKYDQRFRVIIDAIDHLMTPPAPKRRPIGFRAKTRKRISKS
jgi:ORF6N domain